MRIGEECGVFGAFNVAEASLLNYFGLYALQHRGQESTGIVSYDQGNFHVYKQMGLVSDAYDVDVLGLDKSFFAIGHNRYSTTGSSTHSNIQPLLIKTAKGTIAVSHNGNFTNTAPLSQKLTQQGAMFQTTVDSELVLHLVSRSQKETLQDIFVDALSQIEGAFSLIALTEEGLIVARDSYGFRPLVLGKKDAGYVVASETCAFDLIDAQYIREIEPGEILFINKDGMTSSFLKKTVHAHCVFEHVYFARPDSFVFSESVHEIRKSFGKQLAKQSQVDADLVVSIPDSGNSAALGFAEESGIAFDFGMTRNHYIGRTFIQPEQKIRDLGVKIKLNPIASVVKGKRLVVVDDSLVRGTTSKQRVAAFFEAGAKEVHLRIACPAVKHTCHFGVDLPESKDLIAHQKSIDAICSYIKADSLEFLSVDKMLDVIKAYPAKDYCTACFSGQYPFDVQSKGKFSLE